jgi:hypothetical protein
VSLDSLRSGPSVASTTGVVVTVHPSSVKSIPEPTKLQWQTRLHDRVTASVSLDACYGIPPHLLFDLLSDPRTHASIFDAIQVSSSKGLTRFSRQESRISDDLEHSSSAMLGGSTILTPLALETSG